MTEQARVWKSPVLSNLEALHAHYQTHAFARHVHEEYCIGIIVEGVEAVKYRGTTHTAPRGSIVILHPDEAHSNWAAGDEGWSFKVLYPSIEIFQEWLGGTEATTLPFFPNPVVYDRTLFRQFQQFHRSLAQENCDRLKLESHLLTILHALIARHAVNRSYDRSYDRPDSRTVQQIKDYLHGHYCQNPSLEALSQWCGLSPFHLTRLFSAAVGLPPHAYLTHLRVTEAKTRLAQKHTLTQIAIDLGFVDQSHFTKMFKAWVGVTPGQYRLQMQT